MLYLIRKYERHGRADNTCSLKQTRCQMAEEIGFSIKTMDRSIKKLEEDGMLRLEKGKIQVDQSGYLEMRAHTSFVYCIPRSRMGGLFQLIHLRRRRFRES